MSTRVRAIERAKTVGWIAFFFAAMPMCRAADFCERSNQDLRRFAENPSQQLTFRNRGGLFGGGVCWWHSRFTRAALYLLADFRPDLPKPTRAEATRLITRISRMREVVEVPGYANLQDFSRDFANEIEVSLERWQLRDGILHAAWLPSVLQRKRVGADILRTQMDALYQMVEKRHWVVFERLRIAFAANHALLIVRMRPFRITEDEGGYEIFYLDSNHPGFVDRTVYTYGDATLNYRGHSAGPFPDQMGELERMISVRAEHCANASRQK